MCGIFGEIAVRPDLAGRDAFTNSALEALRRRGPDGNGVWSDANCLLGHTRLAILDLTEAAAQPMRSLSGESVIVFNGEIYNYVELRDRIVGKPLRSSGDTAVLLEMFETQQLACLEELLGMFSFAVWRAPERELFLVRDRLGKKPLYFARLGERALRFGSEIAALLNDGQLPRRTTPDRLAEFLQHGYVASPRTGFVDVEQVPPGGWLRACLEGESIRVTTGRYWSLPHPGESRSPYGDWVREFRETLHDAVRIRLRSDVPVGTFLSGGVDSSVVSLLASRELGDKLTTYTVDFDESAFSEAPYAAEVASKIGVRHEVIRLTPADVQELPDLLAVYGDLFGDSSALPTIALCRAARRAVKVAIAGDGGDEVLGGYTRYFETIQTVKASRRVPNLVLSGARWIGRHLVPVGVPWMTRVARLSHSLDSTYAMGMRAYLGASWPNVLRSELSEPWPDAVRSALDQQQRPDLLRMMASDASTYLPDDILVKVDRASMAFGLEVRAPLLDHRLFELSMRADPSFLIANGKGKRPLLESFSSELPSSVFARPKMGFGVPLSVWFRDEPRLIDKILDQSESARMLFDRSAIERMARIHRAGLRDESQRLWQLQVLCSWIARWSPAVVPGRQVNPA